MNIDILIGADFYWSFMAGKARESSLGPTAVESILGWLLSAPYETNVRPTSTNFVNSLVLRLLLSHFWTQNLI